LKDINKSGHPLNKYVQPVQRRQ